MCGWTAALSVCAIVLAESDGLWRTAAIIAAAGITVFAIGKLHLLEPVLRHHYVPRRKPSRNSADSRRLDSVRRVNYQDIRNRQRNRTDEAPRRRN